MNIYVRDNKVYVETRGNIKRDLSYTETTLVRTNSGSKMKSKRVFIGKEVGKHKYEFSLGFIFALVNKYHSKITNTAELVSMMKSEVKLVDLMNLYPWQVEAMDKLLTYKRGIIGSHTGSGKTEMIAILVKNLILQDKRVLIIGSNNAPLQEIIDRLAKYDIKVPNKLSRKSLVNATNPKALCRSSEWESLRKRDFEVLRNVDVVIADETEMTLSKSFYRIKKRLDNCQYFYGFTATADKSSISRIPKDGSLFRVMNGQLRSIVATYGYTAYYKLPDAKDLTIHSIYHRLPMLSGREYQDKVRQLMTHPYFHEAIDDILTHTRNLYIPINSLKCISKIVHHTNLGGRSVTITGAGYKIYEHGKYVKDTDLKHVKSMLANNEIQLILGTISSFRALDLVGLDGVLINFGRATSVVIQYLGRASRGNEMHAWFIYPENNRNNVYTKALDRNMQLTADYYRHCKVKYDEVY